MRGITSKSGLVFALLIAVLAVACGDDGFEIVPATTADSQPALGGKITVFAGSSLTDAFNEIGAEFKKRNPQANVEFNFGGSSALRAQLEQGARADVFASADLTQMNLALQNSVVQDAGKVFVRNSLVIITPKDNPGKINAPADLRKSGLKLVLAAPEVPVGNYARQSLVLMEKDPAFGAGFSAAVLNNLVSNESNVRQVVAKVELGEVDAGIVYGTDVTASVAPKLAVLQIPSQFNVIADYLIALTKTAGNQRTAAAFVTFVLSGDGQAILKKWGFQTAS